jgi:hypothetical protein
MFGGNRPRALFGLLTAAAFCVFVVGLAPHLVHHVFDHEHVQPDCPFATAAERHQAAPELVPAVLTPDVVPEALVLGPDRSLTAVAPRPAAARAPPTV